ncbi:MAG: SMC-Scp complex subunit ScpB [Candidatus Woesearchaeota archaeon]
MSTQAAVEAILFAAGTYVSKERICELAQISSKECESILQELHAKYEPHETFDLVMLGDTVKLTVKKDYLSVVEKIAPDTELSKTVIETLAILAWKSPMLQSELVKVRSTKAYEHIGELRQKGLVSKEKYGNTYILKLTPKFFEYFDIQGRQDIEQLFEKYQKEKEPVQTKVEEYREKEQEQPEKIVEGPSLDQIKDDERKTQKEFLHDFEKKLSDVTEKTTKVVQELRHLHEEQKQDLEHEPQDTDEQKEDKQV